MTDSVQPPPRHAVGAAYVAALAATLGFLPLHVIWALGIPLFADPDRFAAWHADGGGTYLLTLNLLAVLPAILALALVRPWGLRFPSWTPFWRDRPVPRLLLLIPGYGLVVVLGAYTVFAAFLAVQQRDAPDAIFDPWTGLIGIPHFIIWVTGLTIATRSYDLRTRPSADHATRSPALP
ncbi:hypothetical protein ACTI_49390 [Actinoplanes sp. OR16]|uniref:hypothetical protein n=1 Tax=Actinoplanes sp. OR16 TaxID=946334 RepID=UPI000F6B74CC|nr:hypothetical protein [Actinoplanes sp. OR16]BBH68254.1 hypothetical protein ACTI_49390 [Actinoplanes sp. OR16]